ncbi:hypothetical protein [Pelagibacterium halotolerans]|uniref:Uncharacterized protein n=1 Tax=Pelagibacterium halotolerans (strain DSM 22347 / JCM 15775 / CGMCC 1.7692 / B2) TaxID=1082931 RepID=G4RBJ2_PELHB|nr:hypothetical protein [Pelagibacterium halotolerans]AEQ52668.1 hypothetical protein KKY_2660 [Pelagibacterium halotolerans B2]QJR17629.1 hypothetical protein HKM20_03740 [Pelagibacterium halotolerans]SEA84140.1 hypothetical protein SAMN05428936_10963 [Pelagibacterium halotolerans]
MPSAETYERIISMRKAGFTVAAIADEDNLSARYVQQLCAEQGLKLEPKLSGRDVEDMVRMRNDRCSIQSIADHFGVSTTAVLKRLRLAGVAARTEARRRHDAFMRRQVRAMRGIGWTWQRVARGLNVSISTAQSYAPDDSKAWEKHKRLIEIMTRYTAGEMTLDEYNDRVDALDLENPQTYVIDHASRGWDDVGDAA